MLLPVCYWNKVERGQTAVFVTRSSCALHDASDSASAPGEVVGVLALHGTDQGIGLVDGWAVPTNDELLGCIDMVKLPVRARHLLHYATDTLYYTLSGAN